MTVSGWTLILVFVALIAALARPAGEVLFRLYEDRPLPLEAGLYRFAGTGRREQSRIGYAAAVLIFNTAGIALLFAILKLQGHCSLIRKAFTGSRAGSPSTPRSASSPTPTGRTTAARRRSRI